MQNSNTIMTFTIEITRLPQTFLLTIIEANLLDFPNIDHSEKKSGYYNSVLTIKKCDLFTFSVSLNGFWRESLSVNFKTFGYN